MTHHPIVIVGGGPAGIACAVQLYHGGLRPLLIERDQMGGLVRSANWVENYPGFPNGIKGSDLTRLFTEQLLRFEPELLFAEVTTMDWDNGAFCLVTTAGEVTADTLVIATGTVPLPPPELFLQNTLVGKVFDEIIPLIGVKDKTIAIVGSGDAAFDYALHLSPANKVHIICRSAKPKCLPKMTTEVISNKRIQLVTGSEITNVSVGKDGRLNLTINDKSHTGRIQCDSVLLAIGRMPNLDFISPSMEENKEQLEGNDQLFIIGDAVNGLNRQTAIAVGQGVAAAMNIIRRNRQA